MKNYIKITILVFVSFIYCNTFATFSSTLSNNAPLTGNSSSQNAWVVVFPTTDWVKVNAQDSFKLSGNFWIQWVSDSSDPTMWWATFDHWNNSLQAKLVPSWTNYNIEWYAWSKAAWRIFFWNTWIPWWQVVHNPTNWSITWNAWSENLGWISMNWLILDITPPNLSNLSAISADDNKSLTINDYGIWTYNITVENYNNTAISNYNTKTFTHNFQAAHLSTDKLDWLYSISVTDPSWNKTSWDIYVVANVPHDSKSQFEKTLSSSKLANWTDSHYVKMWLFDEYNNPVVNETLNGTSIKKVTTNLIFNNNVDKEQLEDLSSNLSTFWNHDSWDAINYTKSWSAFYDVLFWIINSFNDSLSLNSIYDIKISSLAPTKAWYDNTSDNNDISVQKFSYKVEKIGTYSWVGETTWEIDKTTSYHWNFKFTPILTISSVSTNPLWWRFFRDMEATFTWQITITGSNVSDLYTENILDIDSNMLMSFQNVTNDKYCYWFYNSSLNYTNSNGCNVLSALLSSVVVFRNNWVNIWSHPITFKATPKIVLAWITNFPIKYGSNIKYTFSWNTISYPSFKYNTNTDGWWAVNTEVKIAWIINNSNKNMIVNTWSTNRIVWTITKNDIKTSIYKNVELITKTWKTGNPRILYKTWFYQINSDVNDYDTIIVKWNDIQINNNITKKPWKILWIIALKDNNWNWGNVWIYNDVTKIEWVVIFSDGWLISWDKNSSTYYADTQGWATDQLYIKWSLIVNNTLWWASKNPVTCPYLSKFADWSNPSCNETWAKRYDLNHIRHFIYDSDPAKKIWSSVNWIDLSKPWYNEAPLIIEYDSNLTSNPPPVFKLNK